MGQYFRAINLTKREFVCPWCIGGVAKLWEWAVNPQQAGIFALLLRKSTGSGGGDYDAGGTRFLNLQDGAEAISAAIHAGVEREGKPVSLPPDSIVGRWAGDAVYLAGDYDAPGTEPDNLYNRADSEFTNISKQVVKAWNAFVEIKEMQLKYQPCDSHRPKKKREEVATQ